MNLDLVVVILNDESLQMIRWKQGNEGLQDYGLEFKNPDFIKYAESYGAKGHRVATVMEYKETLDLALKKGGVHVLDVAIDYSKNSDELAISQ